MHISRVLSQFHLSYSTSRQYFLRDFAQRFQRTSFFVCLFVVCLRRSESVVCVPYIHSLRVEKTGAESSSSRNNNNNRRSTAVSCCSSRPPGPRSSQRQMASSPATTNRYRSVVVAACYALTATNVLQRASSHPNCINDFAPSLGATSTFCPNESDDGFCCNAAEEWDIQFNFESSGATGECAELHKEVRHERGPADRAAYSSSSEFDKKLYSVIDRRYIDETASCVQTCYPYYNLRFETARPPHDNRHNNHFFNCIFCSVCFSVIPLFF